MKLLQRALSWLVRWCKNKQKRNTGILRYAQDDGDISLGDLAAVAGGLAAG
jgi:hypothetical protein